MVNIEIPLLLRPRARNANAALRLRIAIKYLDRRWGLRLDSLVMRRCRAALCVHLELTSLNVLLQLLEGRAGGLCLPGRDLEYDVHFLEGTALGLRGGEEHLGTCISTTA